MGNTKACTNSNEPTYPYQSLRVHETPLAESAPFVDSGNNEPLLFSGHAMYSHDMYSQEAYPQPTAYEGQHQAHNEAFDSPFNF